MDTPDKPKWTGRIIVSPNEPDSTDYDLTAALIDMASTLDLNQALEKFVTKALSLTGAAYGALSVLGSAGETTIFIQRGRARQIGTIAPAPVSKALIDSIPDQGAVIINEAAANYPRFGTDSEAPAFTNFLGAALRLQGRSYGRLYLIDKAVPFTHSDAHALMGLASAAANAVQNSQAYQEARNRERWIKASQEITTAMLEGTDEEDALELVASAVLEVAQADTALIVLPSLGQTYVCEIAKGYRWQDFIGTQFPPEGRAQTVIRQNEGLVVDSMARAKTLRIPQLSIFGPALYAPLQSRGKSTGVIVLFRLPGKEEFSWADLPAAESFASQAALALELVTARQAQDRATVLEERARIARDLHDLVIQQMFATGMQINALIQQTKKDNPDLEELNGGLRQALASVGDSVHQLRAIVAGLQEETEPSVSFIGLLSAEASLARNSLGFAPSLLINLDGKVVSEQDLDPATEESLERLLSSRITADVAAVVREGISNAARHAHANQVTVELTVDTNLQLLEVLDDVIPGPNGVLEVRIQDDGRGIPTDVTRRSGLGNLVARAQVHGGDFVAISGSGDHGGTTLVWQIPLR